MCKPGFTTPPLDEAILRDLLDWWMCYDHPGQRSTVSGEAWLHVQCLNAGYPGIVEAYHTIPKATL